MSDQVESSFTPSTAGAAPAPSAAHAEFPEYDCYCGLGPACHLFREMTEQERTTCSQDKRQTAQWLWVNGVHE